MLRGARLHQPAAHVNRFGRNVRKQEALPIHRALPDEPFAEQVAARLAAFQRIGIGRELLEAGGAVGAFHHVHDALLRIDQRRKLGEQQLTHRHEVALALHHAAELREVGLQPVLLGVALRGGAQVADHGVDVVLELGHLAARVHLNGARQVALRHGRGHFRDGAHLRGEVRRQQVHVGREVLPGSGGAGHVRLAAEPAFHADLARHRRHLVREDAERVRHAVDGVGERGDLAFRFHREALAQFAVRHRGHHLHDAAHLVREVVRHHVDVVGEILPGAGDAGHHGLAAELAFGADLARHARHFGREAVELLDHRVDGFLQLQDLALHVHRDLARQVAARDGRGHFGDVAHLAGQVARHRVDVVGEVLPGAGDAGHDGLAAELAFGADLARHARHFGREAVELVHHRVDGFLQLQDLAAHVHRDLARQVAARDGGGHLGDVAHLAGQVAGHGIDVVGEVLPHAADVLHVRLATELAVGADFARHARHFGREGVQLVDHGVHGFLQLQDLAAHVHRDLARQVAARDGGGHFGDVAHLAVRLLAMELTLSVRSFHTPLTPFTSAWPPSLPSVPTSRATRVTSAAKPFNWSTMVFMASLSCRISPFTSTVILRDRSPFAMAVATSAMLRTWPVRFPAMEFTLSVRSFQVPATPGT